MAIVTTDKVNVVRHNITEEEAFSIAQTSESFRVLSGGLYSDKFGAILRELGTNARDAHVEAGIADRPFDVTLPTRERSEVRIRDYGDGMDPEFLMKRYTIYFFSDKRGTNSQVGQYGLGSKSPFAYTDSFTVINRYKGKDGIVRKTVYHCYVAEGEEGEGFPHIAVMSEAEVTDEESGLEIIIPVNEKDKESFKEAASRIYSIFKVRPNILEGQITFSDTEYVEEGKDWGIRKWDGKPYVIMGEIRYPISFRDQQAVCEAHPFIKAIMSTGIDIRCDVGDLKMTPSRESLQNTKSNKSFLIKKFIRISRELAKSLSAQFDECVCEWDVRVMYREKFGYGHSRHKISKIARGVQSKKWSDFVLNGESIKFSFQNPNTKDWFRGTLFYATHTWSGKRYKIHEDRVAQIEPDKHTVFVENDLKRGYKARCIYNIEKHVENKGYYDRKVPEHKYLLLSFNSDDERKKFCDTLGILPSSIILASQLERRPSNGDDGNRSYAKVFELDLCNKEFNPTEVDISEGGYYIPMFRDCVLIGEKALHLSTFTRLVSIFYDLNRHLQRKTIIGLRRPIKKKFLKGSNWVDFADVLRVEACRIVNSYSFAFNMHNGSSYSQRRARDVVLDFSIACKNAGIDLDELSNVEYHLRLLKNDKVQNALKFYDLSKNLFYKKLPEPKPVNMDFNYKEIKTNLSNSFPMLRHAWDSDSSNFVDSVEYVRQMQEKGEV